jgi:hypothetical protein
MTTTTDGESVMKFALILMPLLLACCASAQAEQRFDCKRAAQLSGREVAYLQGAVELRTRDEYQRSKEYAEQAEREICLYVGALAYQMPRDVAQECYPHLVAPIQKLVSGCHINWQTNQEQRQQGPQHWSTDPQGDNKQQPPPPPCITIGNIIRLCKD